MRWNGTAILLVLAWLCVINASSMAQTLSLHTNASEGAKAEPEISPPANSTTLTAGPDYVIGPDDVLAVNVWKEPDLSSSVLVRPDGKITLPLLKDIQADGSTPSQLQARIEKALADYVSKPAVTVIVHEARSHKFNILGEVQKPGSYLLNSPMTVLDAIALAGGLREWAKSRSIYLLRETSPGKRERISYSYRNVVKGKDPDIQLKVRDTIIVP